MKVFKFPTGQHVLYLTCLSLATPAIALAGGLDKGVKTDKHGRSDGQLRSPGAPSPDSPTPKQGLERRQDDKGRLMRPSFDRPSKSPDDSADAKDKRNTRDAKDAREGQGADDFDSQWTSRSNIENDNANDNAPDPFSAPAKPYTKAIRKMIADSNTKGRRTGHIKLYAKRNNWGSGVKIQSCFGDNILTKFTIANGGSTRDLRFQYQGVPTRNSKSTHNKWVAATPGTLISGRYIFLRARSAGQSDVITLRVVGICIDSPSDR